MIQEIRIAPQDSLILIMDPAAGEVPDSMNGGLIAATQSCIAVGTRSACDGDTLISLGNSEATVPPAEPPVFDGVLNTPHKQLAVCWVLNEPWITLQVPGVTTRIRVWANDTMEPDDILITAGGSVSRYLVFLQLLLARRPATDKLTSLRS